MRVIICGGRRYSDKEFMFKWLDTFDKKEHIATVIHGGARGADTLAGEWATTRGKLLIVEYADWDRYGFSAGPRRNRQMLEKYSPDMVVAFTGGKETVDMIEAAGEYDVPVMRAGWKVE